MTTYNTLYESNHCWRSQSQSLATDNNHMCPKPMHNNRQRPHANICPRCHSPKIKRGCCSHCPRDGASPATVRLYYCNDINILGLSKSHSFIPYYYRVSVPIATPSTATAAVPSPSNNIGHSYPPPLKTSYFRERGC